MIPFLGLLVMYFVAKRAGADPLQPDPPRRFRAYPPEWRWDDKVVWWLLFS